MTTLPQVAETILGATAAHWGLAQPDTTRGRQIEASPAHATSRDEAANEPALTDT